ncbi:MAG: class I SAM-dependent methyltransferase [Balneolales bacterium]
MTWAQRSNKFRLTAMFYEKTWRLNSITKLSGFKFTLEDERKLLLDWMQPQPECIYLDLGCSTALYARFIAKHEPASINVAVDNSLPMLESARDRGLEEKVDMYLLYSDARKLPFFDNYIHGISCGGTLNEFSNPQEVMHEARRVIRDDGIFFIMYLNKAKSIPGRTVQVISGSSGLTFFNEAESNKLFESTGFKVENRKELGVVNFAKLRAV